MSKLGATKSITLRLPEMLFNQIKDRSLLQRRSFNAEIVLMLERLIDIQVGSDLAVMREMRDLNRPLLQSLAEGGLTSAPPAEPSGSPSA
jgi:hypothetical protein